LIEIQDDRTWLMLGNWCDCPSQSQGDGAPPRRKSLPDGRMRGE
jgi:hypothetical protein